MVWIVVVLVAVVVVVATAAVVTGRVAVDPMDEPVTSTPDPGLPEATIRAEDVAGIHFTTALRGYRMDQVDDVLDRLQARIAELESGQGADSSSPGGPQAN